MAYTFDLTRPIMTRSGVCPAWVYNRDLFGNMIVGTLPGSDELVTWSPTNGRALNGREDLDLLNYQD